MKNYDKCPPNAEAMVESIRSLGYDLGIAISDIIDNSISASADKIWIIYEWKDSDTYISITDNGHGMDKDILFEAMRLGSISPTEERRSDDLGRFGLGLKTASFSQSRKLTVKSKIQGSSEENLRKWDLDFVVKEKDWLLLNDTDKNSHKLLNNILSSLNKGTTVLWQNLDRLIESEDEEEDLRQEDFFYQKIEELKKYLGMIFHNYLTGPRALEIYLCDPSKIRDKKSKIKAWDPFITANSSTRKLSIEKLHYKGEMIEISPYVLPHHSKFKNEEQRKDAAGPSGWNKHQGFYIYRNKRLLSPGGWLKFYKQEDHYKLARLRIDISNSMDNEWKIGIKKATVFPPDALRNELKRIAKLTREEACKAYRFRGKLDIRGNPQVKELIWKIIKRRDRIEYKIDKKHPVIETLIEKTDKKLVYDLIDLIEKFLPVETIVVSDRENPDAHLNPKRSLENEKLPILEWYDFYLKKFMDDLEISEDEAFSKLTSTEPFNVYKNEIEAIRGVEIK